MYGCPLWKQAFVGEEYCRERRWVDKRCAYFVCSNSIPKTSFAPTPVVVRPSLFAVSSCAGVEEVWKLSWLVFGREECYTFGPTPGEFSAVCFEVGNFSMCFSWRREGMGKRNLLIHFVHQFPLERIPSSLRSGTNLWGAQVGYPKFLVGCTPLRVVSYHYAQHDKRCSHVSLVTLGKAVH